MEKQANNSKTGTGSNKPQTSRTTTPKSTPNISAAPSEKSESLLEEFFTDELKDIYYAEKHLIKALSKMEKEATTQELKQAFNEHRGVTQTHVERLEQVFEEMKMKPRAKKCEAMEGIIKEAEEIIESTKHDTYTRDVALIFAAQKAEHYEIATYGSLKAVAQKLGKQNIADLLAQTLAEEKQTDSTLSSIAETHINQEALQEQD